MESTEMLSHFGKAFIENARTRTIEYFDAVITGKMRSSRAQEMHNILVQFNQEELDIIRNLIANVIDETLFNTLFLFEDSDWGIVNKSSISDCDAKSMDELSDGLSGELFGENGWLAKYS